LHIWLCEKCGWEGDFPPICDEYGDGGYEVCPKCKAAVVLNPDHPKNLKVFVKAYFGR